MSNQLPNPENKVGIPADLTGTTLLYVGGRAHQVAQLRMLAEKRGATLLHHDGASTTAPVCSRHKLRVPTWCYFRSTASATAPLLRQACLPPDRQALRGFAQLWLTSFAMALGRDVNRRRPHLPKPCRAIDKSRNWRCSNTVRGQRTTSTARLRRAIMEAISHRALGTQGLSVSTIGLGCMSLSGVYGPADDAESEKLIQHAIDRGIDHLDSSDMYGWGHNEEVLGRAIKGRRDRVVLVTKFGQTRREGQANGVDGSPQYVQQACEASLKRLGVDATTASWSARSNRWRRRKAARRRRLRWHPTIAHSRTSSASQHLIQRCQFRNVVGEPWPVSRIHGRAARSALSCYAAHLAQPLSRLANNEWSGSPLRRRNSCHRTADPSASWPQSPWPPLGRACGSSPQKARQRSRIDQSVRRIPCPLQHSKHVVPTPMRSQ